MTIDQLTPFLRGSFRDGVARLFDLGGNLGVMDGHRIFDQFGPAGIHSDLSAIRQDAAKSFRVLFGNGGE